MVITHPASAGEETFTNPIVESGADPWVILFENNYYYCRSDKDGIYISQSKRLQDIGVVPRIKIWTPPEDTLYSRGRKFGDFP